MEHEGCIEQICYPSAESERNGKYHIVLVRVPGEDDYEVGLKKLYSKLKVDQFDTNMVLALMSCRPEIITFKGCDIHYPLRLHAIEISEASAEDWVQRYKSSQKGP